MTHRSIDPTDAGGARARHRPDAVLAQVWQRLAPRLALSTEQMRSHVTVRGADMPLVQGPAGVTLQTVYQADAAALRPGEPERLRLIVLPAGAQVEVPLGGHCESAWLLLGGQADIGAVRCAALDYHQRPAGDDRLLLASAHGSRLLVREARPGPGEFGACAAARTTRAGQMAWESLAEGICRRLLAPPQGGEAAYLVRLKPGAAVPAHRHRHKEECLLLAGEIYLDDLLLLGGDFQLAHAGGLHRSVSSERGALLLVHGDVELDCVEPGAD